VAFIRSRLRLTISCVRLSSALVASSKKMRRGRRTSALAINRRWRCPPESVEAPSLIIVCMPIGMARMSSANPAISAASQASSSVSGAEPTMLVKTSPAISLLLCRTTPIWLRTAETSTDPRSWPS